MKMFLPVVLGLFLSMSVGCSNTTEHPHRTKATDGSDDAVLSMSAGIHDDQVQKSNDKELNDKDATDEKALGADDVLMIDTTKAGVHSPAQSPAQSPVQSPTQTPTQSPHQSPIEVPGVTIKEFSHTGSGCPEDSVASNISPDAKAFTLLFDSFFVEAGPAAVDSFSVGKTSCSLKVTLLAPPGWQVALLSVDYRGFADLAAGDSAVISESLRFAGSDETAAFVSKIEGQVSDNFQVRSEITLKTAQWSRCDGVEKTLHLDLSATIRATTDIAASLSLDAVDGELSYKSGLLWKRCR